MSKENPFLKGSRVFGGRWCAHCQSLGVSGHENGYLLSEGKPGAVSVVTEQKTFAVSGKLDTCKIATGKISQESGVAEIKRVAGQVVQKVTEEAVKEAIEEAQNGVNFLNLNSNNWQD